VLAARAELFGGVCDTSWQGAAGAAVGGTGVVGVDEAQPARSRESVATTTHATSICLCTGIFLYAAVGRIYFSFFDLSF
jgi:hypothetical protein